MDEKERAAQELRLHLANVAPEVPAEQFTRYSNDINKRIFELLRNNDANVRLGGVIAVDELIGAETGEEAAVTRYANYLRSVVITPDLEVLRAAASALGKLTSMSSNLAADLVESEVKRCIEWLQSDRNEQRRQAAVIEIKSIAKYNGTLLYAYMGQIIDAMWAALRDPKFMIRNDAAEALSVCLEIIYHRDVNLRQRWYSKVWEEAQNGMKSATVESIHGSLLVYRELLRNAGMFMQPYYTEACETVLRYKDHKDVLIRRTVIGILPDLAKYSPKEYTKRYLVDSMAYLISLLKRDREKGLVFYSIGRIAVSVRSNMAFYLEPILENVREGLNSKG